MGDTMRIFQSLEEFYLEQIEREELEHDLRSRLARTMRDHAEGLTGVDRDFWQFSASKVNS